MKGSKEAKQKLMCRVAYTRMIYAAPIWAQKSLQTKRLLHRLEIVQKLCILKMAPAYCTVSVPASAAIVLTTMLPVEVLLKERLYIHKGEKERKVKESNN